jgi:hypothetical protein
MMVQLLLKHSALTYEYAKCWRFHTSTCFISMSSTTDLDEVSCQKKVGVGTAQVLVARGTEIVLQELLFHLC